MIAKMLIQTATAPSLSTSCNLTCSPRWVRDSKRWRRKPSRPETWVRNTTQWLTKHLPSSLLRTMPNMLQSSKRATRTSTPKPTRWVAGTPSTRPPTPCKPSASSSWTMTTKKNAQLSTLRLTPTLRNSRLMPNIDSSCNPRLKPSDADICGDLYQVIT